MPSLSTVQVNALKARVGSLSIIGRFRDYIQRDMDNESVWIAEQEYYPAAGRASDEDIDILFEIFYGDAMQIQRDLAEQEIQMELAKLAAWASEYPNMPPVWGKNGYQHLDHLGNDPKNFFWDVAAQFNSLSRSDALSYAADIRDITFATIPQDYAPLFDLVDLNHVNFAISYIYPELQSYLDYRWLVGPDARPLDWVDMKIKQLKEFVKLGDMEGAELFRQEVLLNLTHHYPDVLEHLTESKRAAFTKYFFPEVLDNVDLANLDIKIDEGLALKIGLGVGGFILLVGGINIVAKMGEKKNG